MPILNYAVNYEYISEILCENRDQPELMCNGKCYLSKELAENSDYLPKQEITKLNLQSDIFVAGDVYCFQNFSAESVWQPVKMEYISILYRFLHFKNIFHPPLV